MTKYYPPLPVEMERIATELIDAAVTVHRTMGPGLLESVYEACLIRELRLRSIEVQRQVPVSLVYKGEVLPSPLRLDLLVENSIIIELKCVTELEKIHEAQLLSYMKIASKRLGFLLNFHVAYMKDGIRRFIR